MPLHYTYHPNRNITHNNVPPIRLLPANFPPPAPQTPPSSPPRKKHRNDNLTNALRQNLLGPSASDLSDVTLISSDNQSVPACRALLAVRSLFFRNLFFHAFAERGAQQVAVPTISAITLRSVIQFAYTDDADVLDKAAYALRKHSKSTLLTVLPALVDLALVADFVDISALADRTCSLLTTIIDQVSHAAACHVFERIAGTNTVNEELSTLAKHAAKVISKHPHDSFQVPDIRLVLRPQNSFQNQRRSQSQNNNITVSTQNNPEPQPNNESPLDSTPSTPVRISLSSNPSSQPSNDNPQMMISPGVLALSEKSLDILLADKDILASDTYLFQVVYFWVTSGKNLLHIAKKKRRRSAPGQLSNKANRVNESAPNSDPANMNINQTTIEQQPDCENPPTRPMSSTDPCTPNTHILDRNDTEVQIVPTTANNDSRPQPSSSPAECNTNSDRRNLRSRSRDQPPVSVNNPEMTVNPNEGDNIQNDDDNEGNEVGNTDKGQLLQAGNNNNVNPPPSAPSSVIPMHSSGVQGKTAGESSHNENENRILPPIEKADACEGQDPHRWRAAQRLVKRIDFERIKPSFLHKYVAASGLVCMRDLYTAFEAQALEAERGRALYDNIRGGSLWPNGTKVLRATCRGFKNFLLDGPKFTTGRHEWVFRIIQNSACLWIGFTGSESIDNKKMFAMRRDGWAYNSDGKTIPFSLDQDVYNPSFKEGGVVKVVLNLVRSGTFTIVIEGTEKSCTVFRELKGKIPWFKLCVCISRPGHIALIDEKHRVE